MGPQIARSRRRSNSIVIHTSHHTHYVIGTGANDPQKMDPKASRETLDHSIMYIFAVALEDGGWHHDRSYAPRARRPRRRRSRCGTRSRRSRIRSGRAAITATIQQEQAFGGRVVVMMQDGSRHRRRTCGGERASARRPAVQAATDYIRKFRTLADGVIADALSRTASSRTVERLTRRCKAGRTAPDLTFDGRSNISAARHRRTAFSTGGDTAAGSPARLPASDKERSTMTRHQASANPRSRVAPLRRHRRQHRAVHGRPHRQRPALPRLRHPRRRRDLRVRGDRAISWCTAACPRAPDLPATRPS